MMADNAATDVGLSMFCRQALTAPSIAGIHEADWTGLQALVW